MSCLCDDTCQSIPFFKQFTLDWQKAHRILSFLFGGGMMDGWLLLKQQKWTFSRGPLHKGHTYYPSSSCLNAQIVPPSGWSWVTITSTWVIVVVNVTIVHTIFWEPPSTFYLDNLIKVPKPPLFYRYKHPVCTSRIQTLTSDSGVYFQHHSASSYHHAGDI